MGNTSPTIIKRIALFRHSHKGTGEQKDVIPKEGMNYAREVGAKCLRGRGITGVFVSTLFRTTQTAVALLEGAGDCTCSEAPVITNILGMSMSRWIQCSDRGHSLAQIEATYPGFVLAAASLIDDAISKVIEATPENGTSLLVGHTPCIELGVRQLTRSSQNPNGITIEELKECEGVVLAIWDDYTVTIEEEIRHTT